MTQDKFESYRLYGRILKAVHVLKQAQADLEKLLSIPPSNGKETAPSLCVSPMETASTGTPPELADILAEAVQVWKEEAESTKGNQH